MEHIEITTPSGSHMYFNYLEEVAEWLGRVHKREIYVADELEWQITDNNGCEFEIDGVKYIYKNIN